MATTERRAASAALSARTLWSAALLVAAGYGVFLIVVAMRVPAGAELTGQFGLQPAVKAAAASFVLGLAAFLIAHLCFLAALLPLARSTPPSRPRLAAVAVMVVACVALLAGLPTPWTALGAVCFAVSDAMIGISRFVLGSEVLAVPIWWAYAASLLVITAGLLFGRTSAPSARPAV